MRADNHQLLQPLFVSTFSDNVKFDVEKTGPRVQDRRQDRRQGHGAADDLQDAAPGWLTVTRRS